MHLYVYLYISDPHNQNNIMQAILIGATLLKLIVDDE